MEIAARFPQASTAIVKSIKGTEDQERPRLRAGEESDDTQTAYRVAAFQTFFSGRISTFGDNKNATPDYGRGTIPALTSEEAATFFQDQEEEIGQGQKANRSGFGFVLAGSVLQLAGTLIAGFAWP